jgi:hypothetical protein
MAKEEKTPTMWTEELLRDYLYIMDTAFFDPAVEADIAADEQYLEENPSATQEEDDDED